MDFLTLLILTCAVWYVAYVLTSTHGPGGVFEWIREHVWHGRTKYTPEVVRSENYIPGAKQKNGLFDCPVCLSFWVALILVTVTLQHFDLVQALAVAGASMLLHSAAGWRFGQ